MHEHGGKVDDNLAFTAGAPGGKDGRVALITLTRDSTGKIHRIYENGNFFEEQSTANAPDGVSTQRLHIGANNENNRWTGVIVGFRMTVARFTDAQVTEAADLVLTYTDPGTHPPSPNLLGLWRMDEGYGQNEPDASGNGHLMVVGASTTNWTADAPVDFARVCSANGHQWVCSTDVDDFNVQQFTLTGWVRKTTSGLGYLLHKDHGAKLRSWFVQISAAPFILTARIEFTDATNVTLNTTTVLDGVSDYHWAVTWDGSTALLYLDAIEEDRAELGPKTVDYQASQNVAIGNVNNTLEHPRSNVDSTAIYDVAQSPSWITGSKEMTLLDPIPQSAVRAAQIFVVSEDVIRIVFTSAVAVNSTFQNADSYSITDLTASEGVTVREVLPVLGSTSTFIPLRVRGLRSGRTYQLSISGSSVFDPDGDPVPAFTLNWLQARTKVDSVLNSLPMFYGTSIGVTLRRDWGKPVFSTEDPH
jgi:hypothetical protein